MRTPAIRIFHTVILFSFCLSALTLTGCSSPSTYGAANITSEPPGAEIVNLRDNSQLGTTPARVVWKGEAGTTEKVTLQLRKNGFIDKITSIWINHRHSSEAEARANAIDIKVDLEKE
jgi:hypothetical protein